MPFEWTPNKITLLRVAVGFAAVSLFGRGAWANLLAVALTVASIALDALDGHLARKKKMATPVGAQLDILGDRLIENVYFTYFAVVGMVPRTYCGCRRARSNGRARADLGDGGVLSGARFAGARGGLEAFCRSVAPKPRSKACHAGGRMSAQVAAFFDLDGTLMPLPS